MPSLLHCSTHVNRPTDIYECAERGGSTLMVEMTHRLTVCQLHIWVDAVGTTMATETRGWALLRCEWDEMQSEK
jgi:hypothetical protein